MVAAGHVARGTDPQHRGVVTLELTAAAGPWSGPPTRGGGVSWPGSWPGSRPEQAAVTAALGLLVGAAGDDYGITASRPLTAR